MSAQNETPHSPNERFVELLGELDASSEVFRAVVTHLESATSAMRDQGRPPSHKLLHEIGDCNRLFLRLRREVVAAATEAGLPADEAQFQGIGDLIDWIATHTHARPRPTRREPPAQPREWDSPITAEPPATTFSDPIPAEPPPVPIDVPSPQFVAEEASVPSQDVAAPPSAGEDLDPATMEAIATARTTAWAGSGEAESAPVPWPSTDLLFGIEGGLLESRSARREAAEGELAELRRSALPSLDLILSLRTRDDSTIPELILARDAARALREALVTTPGPQSLGEARRLSQGDHPLAHLLTMVRGDDDLTDEDWSTLHESVSEAYGRPLAVVAARQRLIFDGENS